MMKNYHSNELYEDIREQVTMAQVLEGYGFQIRKHLCICPFHNDIKPSMRVYESSFYCFACGVGGDVVKFVALYLGVKNHEAAKIIAGDFGIRISEPIGYAALYRREEKDDKLAQFKQWINEANNILSDYHRHLLKLVKKYTPVSRNEEISHIFAFAVTQIAYISYLLDELNTDDINALVGFYHLYGEEVDRLGRRTCYTGFE